MTSPRILAFGYQIFRVYETLFAIVFGVFYPHLCMVAGLPQNSLVRSPPPLMVAIRTNIALGFSLRRCGQQSFAGIGAIKVSAFFQGKYLQLYKDHTFGLFDEQGKMCIPIDAYEGPIEVLDNDKFVVQTRKHTGVYFKTTGQWVLDSMESINPCDIKTKLSHSFYRFRKNGLYGVMGENCQEIVPPQYAEIRREGRFLVMQTPYHPPENGLREGYKRILYDIFSLSSGTILVKGKSRIAW